MIPRNLEIDVNPIPTEMKEVSWSSAFQARVEEDEMLYSHEPNKVATAMAGIGIAVVGLLLMAVDVGIGLGAVAFGLLILFAAIAGEPEDDEEYAQSRQTDNWEQVEAERDWEAEARGRQEARQREINEIVKAVKTTIRIRCRYCGTLNEESAGKCESCGANL